MRSLFAALKVISTVWEGRENITTLHKGTEQAASRTTQFRLARGMLKTSLVLLEHIRRMAIPRIYRGFAHSRYNRGNQQNMAASQLLSGRLQLRILPRPPIQFNYLDILALSFSFYCGDFGGVRVTGHESHAHGCSVRPSQKKTLNSSCLCLAAHWRPLTKYSLAHASLSMWSVRR